MSTLDADLLAAHAADDRCALVSLYEMAAHKAATVDAACFYLTHAYVFALETNHKAVTSLYERLKAHGRV